MMFGHIICFLSNAASLFFTVCFWEWLHGMNLRTTRLFSIDLSRRHAVKLVGSIRQKAGPMHQCMRYAQEEKRWKKARAADCFVAASIVAD